MHPAAPLSSPDASVGVARIALSCLDLTSLNDADSEADIARLCQRAQGPFGPVAAVCVWPRLAAFARRQLPAYIRVAAVANFPDGGADLPRIGREVDAIVQAGAQEVDLVLPYAKLLAGDIQTVGRALQLARAACSGLVLKVILETGELRRPALITQASRLALDAGADFLKTSTGKTVTSATPQAARCMLKAIAAHARARIRVGFKASGGIRSVADAATYIALCGETLGPQSVGPGRLRIGASSLLDDIEAVLAGAAPGATGAPGAAGGY